MDTTTLLILVLALVLLGGGRYGRGRWYQVDTHVRSAFGGF